MFIAFASSSPFAVLCDYDPTECIAGSRMSPDGTLDVEGVPTGYIEEPIIYNRVVGVLQVIVFADSSYVATITIDGEHDADDLAAFVRDRIFLNPDFAREFAAQHSMAVYKALVAHKQRGGGNVVSVADLERIWNVPSTGELSDT